MKNEHITEVTFKEEWTKALDKAFKKVSKNVEVDGFRKGSVPKAMFIKKYGIESLYEEAINIVLEDNNSKLNDSKVESIVRPVVDVKNIDEKSVTITVKKITKPEIKLGDYKDLGIKKDAVKITEKELKSAIDEIIKESADFVISDKKVANGDIAVIDFSGEVDGEILEGGTGFDYELEIGSNTFIPGFEEKLIGLKTGEEKVLELKFPENYHDGLKGKDVTFNVTIKEVKTLKMPEINEELFKDLNYDVKTEEEFKKAVKAELKTKKEEDADKKFMDEVMEKAIKNMKVEINPEIVEDELDKMVMEIEDSLAMQGANIEMYLKMMGASEEDFRENLSKTAKNRLEVKYLLEAIAKEEKIKATKKEIDEKMEEFKAYAEQSKEEVNMDSLRKYVESIVILEKSSKFLKENN